MPGVRFRLIDAVKSIDVNRQARGSTVERRSTGSVADRTVKCGAVCINKATGQSGRRRIV